MKHLLRTILAALCLLQAGRAGAQKIAGVPDPAWTPYSSLAHATARRWDVIAAQPDGKVLAAGTNQRFGGYSVLRFGPGGALDPSFGIDGTATVRIGLNDQVQDMIVDDEGRIYVAGTYYEVLFNDGGTVITGFAVARFLADGSPDTSYGSGGVAKIPLNVEQRGGSNHPDAAAQRIFYAITLTTLEGIALQPDGKLVLLTYGDELGATQVSVILARLDANGRFDPDFGSNGVALARLPARGASSGLAVATDGSIFVSGFEFQGLLPPHAAFVMKFTPQGILDPAFGSDGKSTLMPTSLFVSYAANEIALEDDGILVAGDYSSDGGGGKQTLVYKLLANGTLDPGFGTNGIALHDFAPNYERVRELAVDAQGHIYVAGVGALGSVEIEPFIGRLRPDGSRDTAFVATPGKPRRNEGMDLVVTDAAYLLVRSFSVPSNSAVYKLVTGGGTEPVLPRIPAAISINTPTAAQFSIIMRDTNGTVVDTANTAQRVDVIGYLFPDAADIGREVRIYVVAETPLGWYYRDANGDFRRWSTYSFDLQPAYSQRVLNAVLPVTMLADKFPTAGAYRFYVGYQDGPLVYSAPPRTIEVTAP